MRSFIMLLGRKTKTRRGVIGTSSPVLGLRPMRSPFWRMPNEPNEDSFTESPRAKLAEITAPYALVAVPLLVETNFGELVDRILVVDAPDSAQLERLMRRDAIPKPEALEMIRAQVDRATRLKAAHDIIDNSGTTEATRRQVELAHRRYLDLAAQRARQS